MPVITVQILEIHHHLNVKPVLHVVVLISGSGRMEVSITGQTGTTVSQVILILRNVVECLIMESGLTGTAQVIFTSSARRLLPNKTLQKVSRYLRPEV